MAIEASPMPPPNPNGQRPGLIQILEQLFVQCAGGWNVQIPVEATIDKDGRRGTVMTTPAQLVQNLTEAYMRHYEDELEDAYNSGYEDAEDEQYSKGGSRRGKNRR